MGEFRVVADGSELPPTLAVKEMDKDGILAERRELQTRGRYEFYGDVVTILKGKTARGSWWARSRRIPQLPVLVHSVAMRRRAIERGMPVTTVDTVRQQKPKKVLHRHSVSSQVHHRGGANHCRYSVSCKQPFGLA